MVIIQTGLAINLYQPARNQSLIYKALAHTGSPALTRKATLLRPMPRAQLTRHNSHPPLQLPLPLTRLTLATNPNSPGIRPMLLHVMLQVVLGMAPKIYRATNSLKVSL